MGRRRHFQKKSNTTFALNINSMTDMFTIMLVFLLQTYSTNAFEIPPQKNIKMPTSVSEKSPEKAPVISFSKDTLHFNEKAIATATDFKLSPDILEQGQLIKPLLVELKSLKEKSAELEDVILQIDENCPYPSLEPILSTASMAGFTKVRLATVSAN